MSFKITTVPELIAAAVCVGIVFEVIPAGRDEMYVRGHIDRRYRMYGHFTTSLLTRRGYDCLAVVTCLS